MKKKQPYEEICAEGQQSRTDPLGMWTGVPADPEEQPVQDADDL